MAASDSAEGLSHNRFSFKQKISLKNSASLKMILDKAEYLRQDKDEDDSKLIA